MSGGWFDEVRDLTVRMVGVPSVTNTPGERAFADWVHAELATWPYFQMHPDHLLLAPIPNDPLNRANVLALVRGSGQDTVALAGHFDVVTAEPYGDLAPWAFEPEALLPRIVDRLRDSTRTEAERAALRDLESGDFLPGRGILDMKSGDAAGMAVLRRFSEQEHRSGNMVLVLTPDEEDRSRGMRWAQAQLRDLAAAHDLTVRAGINLDASEGSAIYAGSVGKLLIGVLVIGRETHAGFPFGGIGAPFLAARIVDTFEWSVPLTDLDGDPAPVPVTLQLRDLKEEYDVTTPGAVWCAFNFLTHGRGAAEVLAAAVEAVTGAMQDGMTELAQRARAYATRSAAATPNISAEPLVLTYSQLFERVGDGGGHLRDLAERLGNAGDATVPAASAAMMHSLWRMSGLTGPAAVVGFASLPYPSVMLEEDSELHGIVAETVAEMLREFDAPIHRAGYFEGISDMSYLGEADTTDLATIAANTPPWGTAVLGDTPPGPAFAVPMINAGPWGRDYHQWLERVYMPYAFETLPELVWRLAHRALQNPS